MNATTIKVAKKLGKLVVTVGLPMVCGYFERKERTAEMRKIAKEVFTESTKS
jgi:hypothetical protein